MKKAEKYSIQKLFEIFSIFLPGASLLILLDTWFSMSWPYAGILGMLLFFLFAVYWSEENKLRLTFWGVMILGNIIVSIALYKSKHLLPKYFFMAELEVVCIISAVLCYLSRHRLWLKTILFLLLFLGQLYFCVEKIALPKWSVCMSLLFFLTYFTELGEITSFFSIQKNKSNIFSLFPFFLVCIFILYSLPVKDTPIKWELLKHATEAVAEKVNSLLHTIEYFFSDKDTTYSMSFTGYDPNGKLGGSIQISDSLQLSVEGRETKSPLYLAGSYFTEYTGQKWMEQSEKTVYTEPGYIQNYEEFMEALSKFGYTASDIQEMTRRHSMEIHYNGLFTDSLFLPPFTRHFLFPKGTTASKEKGYALLLDNPEGEGFSYRVFYTEIDYANTKLIELLRQQSSVYQEESNQMEKELFIYDVCLRLPAALPERIRELADKITDEIENDYDKLKAIEAYLNTLTYTTVPDPIPEGQDFLDFFLFESKKGYCTYFASAMAILARCEGIPTRYVEGFMTAKTCSQNGLLELTGRDAHAWTEAYIDQVGWIPFEPTPGYQEQRNKAWELPKNQENSSVSTEESIILREQKKLFQKYIRKPQVTEPLENITNMLWSFVKFLSILGLIILFILCSVAVRRRLWYRSYISKKPYEQILSLMQQILLLGALFSMPIENGETLSEYSNRVHWRLDIEKDSFAELCELFQSIRFGGKTVTDKDVKRFTDYQEALTLQYKKHCKALQRIWYWCILEK